MTDTTVRFLSPEWVSALDDAARASASLSAASTGVHLVIEHEVQGGDGSEPIHYALRFADGEVRFVWGRAADADVTFVEERTAAEEMSRGTLNAQQAFVLGKLRVRGDVDRLVAARDAFARLDDAFATVRERTEY